MSPAEEIIVKLTAQDGGLNAGMDQAAAKVKADLRRHLSQRCSGPFLGRFLGMTG